MTEKWFLLRQDALASQAETDSRWLAFYEYERYLISAIKAGAQISEGAHIPEIFMRRGGGCVVTIPRWEKEALRMKDGAVNQRSRRHIKKALGP